MSRAATYVPELNPLISPVKYRLNSEPITNLVEPLDVGKAVSSEFEPKFDVCYFYNNIAGSAEVATYQIQEQLFQHLVRSMHLTYLPLCLQEKVSDRGAELWVDMPPLSIEKVVIHARDMGFGEPLAFLDPLPED